MSRTPLPLNAGDISAFARSLRSQLADCERTPSHVELLNMLARSAGCRNFQHLRAQLVARDQLDGPKPTPAPVDYVQVRRLARLFDASGHLLRWPTKFSQRAPCLWVLWSRIPPRQTFTEKQINELLLANHLFGDHALLRRELYDNGLVTRSMDCREYRRIERQPPPGACALIRHLGTRTQPERIKQGHSPCPRREDATVMRQAESSLLTPEAETPNQRV
ncbi:DUF2087 domain-containing protein [Desulfocurvibacter africanus]|uniref:DUF2087 domain-containing protein n=1 Tax=Desulfocurvibacter africanus TaxID=873 RepID=UPI000428180E|nr:DUF2087 domain-containing protein [Desulfocurvibacter africanus]